MNHGTRANYKRGCRCLPCRVAESDYARGLYQRHKEGAIGNLVSPERARQHLQVLRNKRIGYRNVADLTGLAEATIHKIKRGRRNWIHVETETAILAVVPRQRLCAGSTSVKAETTVRRLENLVERGYSKSQLAFWLGRKRPDLSDIGKRKYVTATTAANVERLYHRIERGQMARA